MIYKGSFTAVLDACVLYPASLRDLLLRLAKEELYRPKWTDEINNEWKRNLLAKRNDLEEQRLNRTVDLMNKAFSDARITGYKPLISSIDLPDKDDRHVVAAAVRCNADVIITENVSDFPDDKVGPFDIEIQTPDLFIRNLIDLDLNACCRALDKQIRALKRQPKTREEMRDTLINVGLKDSATFLYTHCSN